MNTSILVRTYLMESRLVDRVLQSPGSHAVIRDLDECIAHTVRGLKARNVDHSKVLKGPGTLTNDTYPKKFLDAWKKRAVSTVAMIDKFLSETDAQRKSVLHRDLTARFFVLPVPQPVRPKYKKEMLASAEFRITRADD